MVASTHCLRKYREWMKLLASMGYEREDREWFSDFWWARHDDDGNLLPPGVRRDKPNDIRSEQ